MQSESSDESKANKKQSLITAQFKGKCRNCGVLGHKSAHYNAKRNHANRQSEVNSHFFSRKTVHAKYDCFVLNRRNEANGNVNNNVWTGVVGTATNFVFDPVSENSEFSENIWIGDNGSSYHYCNYDLGIFNLRDFFDRITIENGRNMEATKI
jgi:hypothetical protein